MDLERGQQAVGRAAAAAAAAAPPAAPAAAAAPPAPAEQQAQQPQQAQQAQQDGGWFAEQERRRCVQLLPFWCAWLLVAAGLQLSRWPEWMTEQLVAQGAVLPKSVGLP